MKYLLMSFLFLCSFFQSISAQDLDSLYAKDMIQWGDHVPEILIDSLSGTSLKDLQGRFVVLYFWASWCPDCRKQTEDMNRLYDTYASDSIVFLNISFDTDREQWQKYIYEHEMGGLNISELKRMKESTTASLFGIKWIPSMCVISPKGRVMLSTVMIDKLEKRLSTLDMRSVVIPKNRHSGMPSYPGGDDALHLFLARNIEYPRTANNYGLEGQTVFSFKVNGDGSISDIRVEENKITVEDKLPFQKLAGDEKRLMRERVLQMFAEEGERVISLMPKWKPGVRFGVPMSVRYKLPINFKIKYNDDRD